MNTQHDISAARRWSDRSSILGRAQPHRGPAFDELPLFRRDDPETSRAAGHNAPKFARGHEARILAALADGPGTKDELAERCGLTDQQVIRRMRGLEQAGLVETTGTTRLSASGRQERVYRVTAEGVERSMAARFRQALVTRCE